MNEKIKASEWSKSIDNNVEAYNKAMDEQTKGYKKLFYDIYQRTAENCAKNNKDFKKMCFGIGFPMC